MVRAATNTSPFAGPQEARTDLGTRHYPKPHQWVAVGYTVASRRHSVGATGGATTTRSARARHQTLGVEGRRLLVSVVNGSMKFSASIVQTNASMFIMVVVARFNWRGGSLASSSASEGATGAACQRRFEWIYETFLSGSSVRFPRLFSSWSSRPRGSVHGRGSGFSAALQPTKRMCVAAENAEGRRT